jgi:hypothetical protein
LLGSSGSCSRPSLKRPKCRFSTWLCVLTGATSFDVLSRPPWPCNIVDRYRSTI